MLPALALICHAQAQVTDLPAGVCELLLAEQRSKQVQAPTWG